MVVKKDESALADSPDPPFARLRGARGVGPMTTVAVQVRIFPLRQSHLSPTISQAVWILGAHGVELRLATHEPTTHLEEVFCGRVFPPSAP
jgi:hypothetical protein